MSTASVLMVPWTDGNLFSMGHPHLLRPPSDPVGDAITDAELVARAIRGSRRCQELLFRRHVSTAGAVARRVLASSPSDVDDLLQDAFETAFRRLESLRDPSAFGGWVKTIVVRTAIKRLRHQRFLSRLGIGGSDPIEASDFVVSEYRADALVELSRIDTHLQRFPREERVVLLLHRVEGFEYEEIARLLGLSRSTVRRRLAAAEERIDRYLANRETGGSLRILPTPSKERVHDV